MATRISQIMNQFINEIPEYIIIIVFNQTTRIYIKEINQLENVIF